MNKHISHIIENDFIKNADCKKKNIIYENAEIIIWKIKNFLCNIIIKYPIYSILSIIILLYLIYRFFNYNFFSQKKKCNNIDAEQFYENMKNEFLKNYENKN